LRCTGVPVAISAQLALEGSFNSYTDEVAIERHIKRGILKDTEAKNFKLGGRMKGCEFYDCLFFYLTRHLKVGLRERYHAATWQNFLKSI